MIDTFMTFVIGDRFPITLGMGGVKLYIFLNSKNMHVSWMG